MFSFKVPGEKAQQRDFGEAALAAAEFTHGETAAGARERLIVLADRVSDRKSLRSLVTAAAESGVCCLPNVSALIHALVTSRRNADAEAAALLCRMLNTTPAERERLAAAVAGSLRSEIVEWRVRAGWRAWIRTAAVMLPLSIVYQLAAGPIYVGDGILLALLRIIGIAVAVGLVLPLVLVPAWPLFLGVSIWLDAPRRRLVGFRVRALVGLDAPETSVVCARLTRSRLLLPVATGGMAASLRLLTEENAASVSTDDIGALLQAVPVVPRQYATEVVQALGRVGNSQALPGLRRLSARWPDGSAVREDFARVCRGAIQQIESRLARVEASRTLLRAAAEGAAGESLLRAARSDASGAPEEMLRATDGTA